MTLGRLAFEAGAEPRWIISDLQPHVAMVFKRLFQRVRASSDVLYVGDSDEARADLEWFMQRYPLETAEAERIAEGARNIAVRIADRDRILLPDWSPPDCETFREGRAPYRFQQQAGMVAARNPNLLLGDEVGLGKTISAFAAISAGAPLPVAIVVEPHLANQWRDRAEEFTNYRVHVIKGTKPYAPPAADIYVFRYSNIAGWVDVFTQGIVKSVTWDEIQQLRAGFVTAKGDASRVLRDRTRMQMGLTATPIYNFGDEIHAIMEFIRPGLLGDIYEFRREWCGGNTKVVKDPDALGAYLQGTGFFLRRREDDDAVDAALPPANVLDFEVRLDQDAIDDERELLRQLAYRVLEGSFTEAGSASRELDLRMRQLTGIGKARAVAAYVRLLLQESPRVLLAGWHREVYRIWQEALADFQPVLYTGSETNSAKGKSVDAFCKGDARVMMISLRSGAGLDGLQHHCRDIAFGELDWSPQVHHQLIGRLRRPGQKEQVTAHYIHANDGSDPVLMQLLGLKSDQARGINDPGKTMADRYVDESRIRKLAEYVLANQPGAEPDHAQAAHSHSVENAL